MRIRTLIKDEKGLTLLELIISMALLSIIMIATMYGVTFAYTAFISSEEYMEDVYVTQSTLENDLSNVSILTPSSVPADTNTGDAVETIYFDWEAGSGLNDFQSAGIRGSQSATGGTYLEEDYYIFFPLENSDQ